MVRIVVIGTYSDTRMIGKVIDELGKRGFEVFPSGKEFENLAKIIQLSDEHAVSDKTMKKIRRIFDRFMDEIRESDFVYVFNEKEGKEYIGSGTLMQIGFTLGLKKPIFFFREPHIEEVLSLAGPLVLQLFLEYTE